jgi:lipoprotein-releasing system permease protein
VIFPFYIARRYLISKKSHNIINIVSLISVGGITIGAMALILVLSVFNGFEGLVSGLFNSFNPDLKVSAMEGKYFHSSEILKEKLLQVEGVNYVVETVEENALARFTDKQHIVMLKGVETSFHEMTPLDSFMVEGRYLLESGEMDYAIIGAGVAYYLGIYPKDFAQPMSLYMPRRTKQSFSGSPDQSFSTNNIPVSGVFSIQNEYDMEYVIVPIAVARELMEYTDEVSALEIGLEQGVELSVVQENVKEFLGPGFDIRNRFEQQSLLYRIMKSEKWAVFFILSFILIIAAFNVIGSLSMLILDKKKDISVLWSLGADKKTIKRIFYTEGMIISLSGGGLGLLLGGLLAWMQQHFGFLKLGGGDGSYIVEAYPVQVHGPDFLLVLATVLLIGALTTWYPVSRISRKYLSQRLNFFLMR